ncbi:MAG: glycosyltransferase [Myxococcales bacterium]|nr:glycosyltransferase [Myxococcales bacterium]
MDTSLSQSLSVEQANQLPRISVLLPVYNAAPYVEEAVRSILAQTVTDFELIVIDDGSTDGSGELLTALADEDSRIRLVRRPNTGIVGALNEALGLARADLVARMDADDIAWPTRFAKQAAYLSQHPECVAVGSAIIVIDPLGEPIKQPKQALSHEEIDAQLLSGYGWALVHPAAMMRRQAVLDLGGYRTQYNKVEDLDLFLRLAERGRLANLPDVLLSFRQHFTSTCVQFSDTQSQRKLDVVKEAYQRRGMPIPEPFSLPKEVRLSGCAQHLSWAMFALRNGRTRQALRHAKEALQTAPRSPQEAMATTKELLYAAQAMIDRYRTLTKTQAARDGQ